MKLTSALVLSMLCGPCPAQPAAAQPAPPWVADGPPERAEPEVKHLVHEDEGSKIDELRVRGQTQHVVVTPKVGITKSYEILINRSGHEPADGTGGANSAAGKRVWNVLDF